MGTRSRGQLAAVFVLSCLPFLPALGNGFVDWDDRANFVDNPHYRGFGPAQLRWMWTSIHLGHFMPLTWMSNALDHALFGLDPTGYHLTNILLHGATATLLAVALGELLQRARPGRSARDVGAAAALAAVLYAVHPLRVESVAWATERRDVLSGALLLVALIAYLRWTAGDGPRWNSVALIAFALSLLSKTSGFVLPLVLLALDAYPLGRLARGPDGRRPWAARLREKQPWFAMGALAAWVAWLGQFRAQGALSTLTEVDLLQRATLALHGLGFHVVRTLWPAGLTALHPLDQAPALTDARALIAAGAVLVITGVALARRGRAPGLLTGWGIYLVCLLPVVGIVHVGVHFAADRYGYLATMPFAALVAALALDLSARPRARTAVFGCGAALALVLAGATWRQTGFWRDSVALWSRVAEVYPTSHVGHHRLGVALLEEGRPHEAARSFERALELRPEPVGESARYDLAEAAWALDDAAAALASVDLVLAAEPTHLAALLLAEEIHVRGGQPALACARYERALAADPTYLPARVRRSQLLRDHLGDAPQALAEARRAVALDPASDAARGVLGLALLASGDPAEAEGHLRLALAPQPGSPVLLEALAMSLEGQGRQAEAELVRAKLRN